MEPARLATYQELSTKTNRMSMPLPEGMYEPRLASARRELGTVRVMRFIYLVAIPFCVLLVGCDQAALMKRFTPPEEESELCTLQTHFNLPQWA